MSEDVDAILVVCREKHNKINNGLTNQKAALLFLVECIVFTPLDSLSILLGFNYHAEVLLLSMNDYF